MPIDATLDAALDRLADEARKVEPLLEGDQSVWSAIVQFREMLVALIEVVKIVQESRKQN